MTMTKPISKYKRQENETPTDYAKRRFDESLPYFLHPFDPADWYEAIMAMGFLLYTGSTAHSIRPLKGFDAFLFILQFLAKKGVPITVDVATAVYKKHVANDYSFFSTLPKEELLFACACQTSTALKSAADVLFESRDPARFFQWSNNHRNTLLSDETLERKELDGLMEQMTQLVTDRFLALIVEFGRFDKEVYTMSWKQVDQELKRSPARHQSTKIRQLARERLSIFPMYQKEAAAKLASRLLSMQYSERHMLLTYLAEDGKQQFDFYAAKFDTPMAAFENWITPVMRNDIEVETRYLTLNELLITPTVRLYKPLRETTCRILMAAALADEKSKDRITTFLIHQLVDYQLAQVSATGYLDFDTAKQQINQKLKTLVHQYHQPISVLEELKIANLIHDETFQRLNFFHGSDLRCYGIDQTLNNQLADKLLSMDHVVRHRVLDYFTTGRMSEKIQSIWKSGVDDPASDLLKYLLNWLNESPIESPTFSIAPFEDALQAIT